MSGSDPDAMDVTVELGLCALLLGESNKALNFLGLAPNANKLPNEEVLAYVQVTEWVGIGAYPSKLQI